MHFCNYFYTNKEHLEFIRPSQQNYMSLWETTTLSSKGHSQTRLMIYHCGINGVFEAIYHGIPVICIPIQGDQWDNVKRLEVKGVGLQLELTSLTSHVLVEAVNNLLEDKRYALI